jgi:hypothetical protein
VKKAKTTSEPELPQEDEVVVFEYIKSQLFRVIHSDGAIGGITPTGNVHVAFYSDRAAIPKVQVHRKNPDGTLGDLLKKHTVVRPGIVREMDVDVILSPAAAEALMLWLSDRLKDLKQRRALPMKVHKGKG